MPTDEIPDDIAALLRDAREADVPPAGAKERVWAETMARVDGPGSGPGTRAPSSTSGAAALSGFAAGVLSGIAGTYAVLSLFAAPPEVVYVPVEVPVVEAPTPKPHATPARTVSQVRPTPAPTPGPKERATERAWLDAARTALSRGDFEAATQALETARTRFPEGKLGEEREALAVHALIARGDAETARLAADTFRKQHERSLFLPAIEDAMREMESQR